jgi:hypothetical protein
MSAPDAPSPALSRAALDALRRRNLDPKYCVTPEAIASAEEAAIADAERDAAIETGRGDGRRVEVTMVLELGSAPRLDDGTVAVAIEEVLQGEPLIVGPTRTVVEIRHAEVVEIGRAAA